MLLGTATVLHVGRAYYLAPAEERLFSPEHALFASSGRIGLIFGIGAASLVMFNLLYLVRKQVRRLDRLGTLRAWLGWHVTSGLLAGTLVLVHSTLQVKNLVTRTCVWALAIVIVTGVLGRYMVRFIPRTRSGERVGIESMQDEIMVFVDRARPALRNEIQGIRALQRLVDATGSKRRPCPTLTGNLLRLRQVRADMQLLRRSLGRSGTASGELGGLLRRTSRLYSQGAVADFFSQVMDSWRIFHRVLALIFVASLSLHVGVAIYFGYVRL